MPPKITLKGQVSHNTKAVVSLNSIVSQLDMAQSRYFTIQIFYTNSSGTKEYMGLNFGKKTLMPVNNITYTVQGIDVMTLSLGIFKDIPIPVGLRLPKVSLSLNDTDDSIIEKQFRNWYNSFSPDPNFGYVGYLNDMVRYMTYKSYKVDGTLDFSFTAPIILEGDFTYTRSYEANDLRVMEAQVIIVGDGKLT